MAVGVVASSASCASFGSEPPQATTEAGEDGGQDGGQSPVEDASGDAGARRCSAGAPFGPATAIGGLGSYSVEAVRFAASNRQVVYLSLCPADGGKPGCDMYQGSATTTADTYGSFNPMSQVNAPGFYDSYPTVTGDTQWLLFGSGRAGGVKIFQAPAVAGVFQNAVVLKGIEALAATNEPYLLLDGRTLYFGGSASAATLSWHVYRSRGGIGSFGAPELVAGVNGSTSEEFAPVPSEDELEIFFASTRAPGSGSNLDMWMAKRASRSEPFGPAVRLDDLSGAQNEFPTSLSEDNCELYYIRKTGSGSGVGTAYVARRMKP